MGLFLSMFGVVGCNQDEVVDALRAYAESKGGLLEQEKLTKEEDHCLVIPEGFGGVTILYPARFLDWEDATQHLSRQLEKPVFSFHIHDSDLWMYSLYEVGDVVDQFNPVPDYWQELDEDERIGWQGNAYEVAKRVPGLSPQDVARYLVQWDDDIFDSKERKKAYPGDRFYYGDDWQLTDFMSKLGLDYPIDDSGAPHGDTYRFECAPR